MIKRSALLLAALVAVVAVFSAAGIGARGQVLDELEYMPAVLAPDDAPPTPPTGCSICSYDAYNCSDFDTQAAAQACFDFCMEQVGYDVHQLDADDNGVACEALPGFEYGGWVFER